MPKSKGNGRYMGMIGGKSQKVMKDHGNTQSIETTSPQQFDMGRVKPSKMESRGYSNKAFDYKY